MSVNEVNMAKWIVALRSGRYQQGQRRLLRDGKYCCLGVLCEISGTGHWDRHGLDTKTYFAGGKSSAVQLLPAVSDWLGINTGDPRLDGEVTSCVLANDTADYSLPRIADALEATYLPGKKAEEILSGASQ